MKDGKPDVREEGSCLPSLPQHQAFIQEFTDFTSRVSHEAHTEKVRQVFCIMIMAVRIVSELSDNKMDSFIVLLVLPPSVTGAEESARDGAQDTGG